MPVNISKPFMEQLHAVCFMIQITPIKMMMKIKIWETMNRKIGEAISMMMSKMMMMTLLGKSENLLLKLSMQSLFLAQFNLKSIGLSLSNFSQEDSLNVMIMLNVIFLKLSKT
jgi:hypothetical protein